MTEEQIMQELTSLMNAITRTHCLVESLIEDYSEIIATTDNPKAARIQQIKDRAVKLLQQYRQP